MLTEDSQGNEAEGERERERVWEGEEGREGRGRSKDENDGCKRDEENFLSVQPVSLAQQMKFALNPT